MILAASCLAAEQVLTSLALWLKTSLFVQALCSGRVLYSCSEAVSLSFQAFRVQLLWVGASLPGTSATLLDSPEGGTCASCSSGLSRSTAGLLRLCSCLHRKTACRKPSLAPQAFLRFFRFYLSTDCTTDLMEGTPAASSEANMSNWQDAIFC